MVRDTTNDDDLIAQHDKAAKCATVWRRLQRDLAALPVYCVADAASRAAAEAVMVRLVEQEAAALGRMVRLREQLGRRPPRRPVPTAGA